MAPGMLLGVIEVVILALTLLVSVGLSVYVVRQTQKHFQLSHAQQFIARFNGDEMAAHQRRVDALIDSGGDPALLADSRGLTDEQLGLRDSVLAVCNLLQELGTAYRRRVVDRRYTWDVFGAMIGKYWRNLSPFVSALRKARGRGTLFQDFEFLAGQMAEMDRGRGLRPGGQGEGQGEEAYIYLFGYGSLIDLESLARTTGRHVAPASVREAWLDGWRRTWNVYDLVRAEGDGIPMPMAFYNIEPDPGARCNGVLIPLRREDLEKLDLRERQYDRVEVTAAVNPPPPGRTYTYVGKPAARRLPEGTVVAASYEQLVDAAVRRRGERFAEEFRRSTAPHDLPRFSGEYEFAESAELRVSPSAAAVRAQPVD